MSSASVNCGQLLQNLDKCTALALHPRTHRASDNAPRPSEAERSASEEKTTEIASIRALPGGGSALARVYALVAVGQLKISLGINIFTN